MKKSLSQIREGVRESRPRSGGGREGKRSEDNLKKHLHLMQTYMKQGMSKADASKKAYQEVIKKPLREAQNTPEYKGKKVGDTVQFKWRAATIKGKVQKITQGMDSARLHVKSDRSGKMYAIDHKDLHEDAPTNNAGGGNIDGIGVGEKGEPGFSRRRQKKWQNQNKDGTGILRRKIQNRFKSPEDIVELEEEDKAVQSVRTKTLAKVAQDTQAFQRKLLAQKALKKKYPKLTKYIKESEFRGHKVFEVPASLYNDIRVQKQKNAHWRKFLQDDEACSPIRDYANRNRKPIIIRDANTGAMMYVRYGVE